MVASNYYGLFLDWIVREHGGAGGWPPADVNKVSGWTTVRMVADVFHKPTREVARDLIERYEHHGES
jgi:hypothetical protein